MKKIISTLLIVVILLNFIFCGRVQATDDTSLTDDITSDTITGKDLNKLINDGEVSFGGQKIKLDPMKVLTGGFSYNFSVIGGLLARFLNLFPHMLRFLMAISIGEFFSIQKAVFNEIGLFNIDYFNFTSSYTIGTHGHEKTIALDDVVISVRNSVAQCYYIFRLIAMAISLLVLIYVGIRMALSTISEDKAKYKKMLISWVESIVLLFAMQYIISLIINVGNIFSNFMYNFKCILDDGGGNSFETEALSRMDSLLLIGTGWTYASYSVVYWLLIYVQSKFYFMYFKRVIVVGFLILISPIITITYPIDKVGDGKAQAFSVWSHELMTNVAIQPIHAIIYLVFLYTAGEIAKTSIWVAIAFLLILTKVEKIILQLFNLKNVASLRPVHDQRKK